jgi:hypothetical protein
MPIKTKNDFYEDEKIKIPENYFFDSKSEMWYNVKMK